MLLSLEGMCYHHWLKFLKRLWKKIPEPLQKHINTAEHALAIISAFTKALFNLKVVLRGKKLKIVAAHSTADGPDNKKGRTIWGTWVVHGYR